MSDRRSTRCRRSSAPSPPPRRYRYLLRRCAWSRTKGNPQTTDARPVALRTKVICKSALAQIITSVTLSNRRSTRCRRSSAPSPPPRRYRYLLRRCAWSRTKGNPQTTDARPVALRTKVICKSALAQIITSVTLSNRRSTRCRRSSAPSPPPRRCRYLLRRCAWSRTKGNPQTTDARPVALRTKVICKSALAQIITSVTLSNRRSTRCRRSSAPSPPPRRCRYLLRRCAWSRTKGNPQTTDARPVALRTKVICKSALAQIITSVTLSNRRSTRCRRSSAPSPPPRRCRYLLRRCAWSRTKGNPQTTDARPVALRTKVICKSALAQIITSVTLSNRRSTRCRRSSAPSPPPRRYRYLLRRCAWSRTKGNPQTTDARPVALRTKVICKSALAQIITSVTLSNRRSTRCRRSSAPSPPPRRCRYLLRRCAWSRTKGNPQTTDAECKLVSSNCDDRRRVTCWRCPSSFPRMHSGSACQRVTAAASPRCVPTERRKRARKSGRDHPSSRQHAECKLVSSNCDDRRCVMCWRCPSSFPRMHSGSASERVTAAASPRCVPTERRKRARKSGRDHPSSRQHAEWQTS